MKISEKLDERSSVMTREISAQSVLADVDGKVESVARSRLLSFGRRKQGERLALSFAQQRLWFLAQMKGASEAYNISIGYRVNGDLERTALRQALDRIIARHEALRTSFGVVDGEPVQRIASVEDSRFHLLEHDLSGERNYQEELDDLIRVETNTPFDLECGPLIRGRLIRVSDNEHVLLLTMHHIVSDAWSMGVLTSELSKLYSAFVRDEADPLSELKVQFYDYALWQREWIESDRLHEQAAYWKANLNGAPTLLELPADHPRPAEQNFAGAFVEIALAKELTAKLKELSRRHRTTPYMTFFAAWAAVMARLSGQQDVVIGSPSANRGETGSENLIGFFVNTLAVRLDLSGSPTIGELLRRTKTQILEAQQHQDIPFERVVELVQPVRSLSYSPLCQVMFTWQNLQAETLRLAGCEVRSLGMSFRRTAKFDVTLYLQECNGDVTGRIEYATSLFERETIKRYRGYFLAMLKAMVANDTQCVDRIVLPSPEERCQVLEEWNETPHAVGDGTLPGLLERQAEQTPNAVAVVCGQQQLSYGELNQRANQLARYLRSMGVGPEVPVAICVERSAEMVVGMLGVLKAGGAYVPLDANYPGERLEWMLEDTQAPVLLTQSQVEAQLPPYKGKIIRLDREREQISRHSESNLESEVSGENLAYVIYTSGSTGRPKGVGIRHRSAVVLVNWAQEVFSAEELSGVLASTSICFDLSVYEILAPLSCGGKVIVAGNALELEHMEGREQVKLVNTVPAAMQELVRSGGIPESVVTVNLAGEALTTSLVRQVYGVEKVKRVLNLYGPSEGTTYSTYAWIMREEAEAEKKATVRMGRPIFNTQVYVVDEDLEPVPVGVAGELYIGGDGLARGYLNRPELTAERFVPNPFSRTGAGQRLYCTGDQVRWMRDGDLEFLGRQDQQVKIRGFRIELGEIEAALQRCAGVRQAVVTAWGEESADKRLVAYYTCEEYGEVEASAEALRAALAAGLPDYMVPAAYVRLEHLPMTRNGKVDRRALPAPDADAYVGATYEEPRGEAERELAAIWADLLKVERISRHNNFFSLGGHSLLAGRMVNAVRTRLGGAITVRDVFAHPVLKDLGMAVQGAQRSRQELIPRVEHKGLIPLSYGQQRLWFLSQTEGGSRAYHIPLGMELRGKLNVQALCRALDRIVERHETLRTTFEQVEGEPRQQVREAEGFRLVQEDVRRSADPLLEVRVRAQAELEKAFDLERGPVIRERLIQHGEEAYTLLVTMHHIASDEWSMAIFLREMGVLYGAFTRGEVDQLAALPVQYADYALWQRSEAVASEMEMQGQYWERKLAGAPAVLEVPLDRPRPAQQDYAGGAVPIELDGELSRELKALSQRAGTTLFMTLMGGWMAVLGRLARQADVVVGTPVANRGHAQIEGLIGFFVNALALRVEVKGNSTVRELLERVKECALEAQQHQEIPFEQVVERVRPERSPSHSPIFQTVFTWQNNEGRSLKLPGLEVRALESAHVVSKFDLILFLREKGEEIAGALEYATSLYDEATARRMGGYLQTMLRAMVEDEEREIGAIGLLTAEERRQVLEGWNDTQAVYPAVCVHQLMEQQVQRTPDATAVLFQQESLTYEELNRRTNQLAHFLVRKGIRPGCRVALCVERGLSIVIGVLGAIKAGGAYVPLDPAYPRRHLARILRDAAPEIVLVDYAGRAALADEVAQDKVLQIDGEDTLWAGMPEHDIAPESLGLDANDPVYVIYTSGSTGVPKGAMVRHSGVVNIVTIMQNRWANYRLARMTQFASISFDASAKEIFYGLASGITLVLRDHRWLTEPGEFWALCAEERINYLNLPARLWQSMTRGREVEIPECVRLIVVGGESVESDAVREWVRREGHKPALMNAYGPTEATINATLGMITDEECWKSIGQPIGNTRIYILDERGEPVPAGVIGEIYIGGAGVAYGYLKREELTAERFVADPYGNVEGARMYRTGDLGRWRGDGTIEFCGRNDFQVKVRGYRVELGEIEAQLREVSGVGEAVVVVGEQETGEKRLVAYYTSEANGKESVNAEVLRTELAAALPEYMVPAAYVWLEHLPTMPNGKLDRRALPEPDAFAYAGVRYGEPQGETEQALAAVWAELLKVERISRHDNFFNLGGHSLLAVLVLSIIRRRFGIRLVIRDFFAHPVLKDLASAVQAAERKPQELIPKVEHSGLVPLSYAQQRLWFLSQTEDGSRAYHVPFGMELRGKLDVKALSRAVDRIVERHEALRTTFEQMDGEPRQRVRKPEGFRLLQEDVRGSADPLLEVKARAEAEAQERFDLERGPVIRGRLVRHGEEAYTLLVTMHHIASDGWSMGIFWRELGALYRAFTRGEGDPLEELPLQYADYALWQRSNAVAGKLELQGQAWERMLAGAPAVLELPMDRPRPMQQDYAGAVVRLELDGKLLRGLKALSQRVGTTLFMTALGGWMAVLGRLARREDVVVGTPVANRGHAQIGGLIGFFVNALALRVEVKGGLTVPELLGRVKECVLEAQQHQDIPFEQVVERVRSERSLSHSPIFQTMFAWQNNEGRTLNLPGLEVRTLETAARVVSKFDLTLFMREKGEGILAALEYATSLFDEATVRRIGGYVRTMLEAMVEDEGGEIGAIELLTAEERRQILEEWNDTEREVARGTLAELFEHQAKRTPDRVAIVQGKVAVSYRELDERANRLAHYLCAQGVDAESRVAIALERSIDLVVCQLATLKAGGGYLPLDIASPMARLKLMVEDARPVLLLVRGKHEGTWAALGEHLPVIDLDQDEKPWEQMPSIALSPRGSREGLAYIIYTSGSTGEPRGVMVAQGSVADLVLNTDYVQLGPSDVMGHVSNTAFDAVTWEIWGALLTGAKLVCIEREDMLSPRRLGKVLESEGVTALFLTTALFNRVASEAPESFAGLDHLLFGGERVDPGRVWEVLLRGQPRQLLHVYGPTETTTYASWFAVERISGGRAVPIGRPIANSQIYILDERGEPAPVGVVGEIYIGGTGVAWGYLNREELTAERFVADPYGKVAGARMYRTGDLGKWRDDGTIEFCGRNDYQVKLRGYRVELGEIEARLREVNGVGEAVVVAREEESGEKRLVAYYTYEGYAKEELSPEGLREELAGVLPEYMVPVAYVRLERLPMTASGKVDRRGLPEPDANAYAGARYEEPQGETEQALAEIWAELLKVERISRHDNFFDLGGHSLLAVRVVNAVRARFEWVIAVRDVFAHPVLHELADRIVMARLSRFDPADLMKVLGTYTAD